MAALTLEPRATVDLAALGRNVQRVRSRLAGGAALLAAVKADAYGHGAATVAPFLQAAGADRFGVATAAEALALRAAGVTAPLLTFGPVGDAAAELAAHEVALTVADAPALETVRARAGRRVRVHVKVDTGMGRLGTRAEDAAALVEAADRAGVLEGIYTHFACADEVDAAEPGSHAHGQLDRFTALLERLERSGCRPPLVHAANSAALLALPGSHLDLVRAGIALYGHHASATVRALAPELEPVLTLDAAITFVKRVRRGETVSYGARWIATGDTTVATVRLGYADGYLRALGGRAHVRHRDRDVPVIGRVCMDQLMLDLGPAGEAEVGERVVVFGPGGPDTAAVAELTETIPYELLTRLGPRVERRYVPGPSPTEPVPAGPSPAARA